MILGIIIGILGTLFILSILGMYKRLKDEIKSVQVGVLYLVQREYEMQKTEEEYNKIQQEFEARQN